MGLLGNLDLDDVPQNPYWVAEGDDYIAIITKAEFWYNEKKDENNLVIQYKISNPESRYYGKPVTEYLRYYPELDKETFKNLPPEEQRQVETDLFSLQNRLCGNPKKERKGLGISLEEFADPDWDPSVLKDREVKMGVKNSGDDNQFTNVKWVELNM